MPAAERVLVVDQQTDTTEVLKAVFEPRGILVTHAKETAADHAGTDTAAPSLVVIDLERSDMAAMPEPGWADLPQVVIGRIAPSTEANVFAAEDRQGGASSSRRTYLRKPFQYGELVRAIELLLSEPSVSADHKRAA